MENVIQASFGKKPEEPAEKPALKTVERELSSFQVDACCEKCDSYIQRIDWREQNDVWMKEGYSAVPLGGRRPDPVYLHRCPQCKHEMSLPIAYPTVIYKFKE